VSRHNRGGIFDQKMDCWCLIHVTIFRGGSRFIVSATVAENPSYATGYRSV